MIDTIDKLNQGIDMFGNYQIQVHPRLSNSHTPQEALAQRLDLAMHNPYTLHVVLGRNGRDELLFVSCQHSPSDGRDALFEACGFYACKTGQWPDFFSFNCEIRSIQAQGTASPSCLEVASRRQMFLLTKKDMENHENLKTRGRTEIRIAKSRRRVAIAKAPSHRATA